MPQHPKSNSPCSQCQKEGGCQGCAGGQSCQGGCCGGSRSLVLCPEEASILLALGQVAFLPVLWRPDEEDLSFSPLPGYGVETLPQFSDLVRSLRNKGLISREIDTPLQGTAYPQCDPNTQRPGSLALTALGQEAVDWLEWRPNHQENAPFFAH